MLKNVVQFKTDSQLPVNIPRLICSVLLVLAVTAYSSPIQRCTDVSGQVTFTDLHCGDASELVEITLENPGGPGMEIGLTKKELTFLQQREDEKRSRRQKAEKVRERRRREFALRKQACKKAKDSLARVRTVNVSQAKRWKLRMAVHDKC